MHTPRLLVAVIAAGALGVALAGCQSNLAAVHEEAASARSPVVGKPAPDFTLPDQDGKPVTLSDLRGQWVVLYFYPKDDTPGCTCEATEFTALLGKMRDMNAKVYGISEDSPRSHRLFIEHYKLGLNLLSDEDHKVMREYGAYYDAHLGDMTYGKVVRTTYIIGPEGKVRWIWPEVIPEGHAERVRQRLAELQAGSAA